MRVSIVVVNYNGGEFLRRCLASTAWQDHECILETILVDNASRAGDLDGLKEKFPALILIRNTENVGFARANNQGITIARGELVLLLNNDAELRPGAVRGLAEMMDTNPRIGVVGPRVLNSDGSLQLSYARFPSVIRWFAALPTQKGVRHYEQTGYGSPHQVEWLSCCCLLVRRQLLDELGGFDEEFFFNFEDVDLCKRAYIAGWACWYTPYAEVIHHKGISSASPEVSERIFVEKRRSQLLYFRKHGSGAAFTVIKIVSLTYAILGVCWNFLIYAFRTTVATSRQAFYWRLLRGIWMISRQGKTYP